MRGRLACLVPILWSAAAGCAALRVEAARPGDPPRGIRVYPPSVYLLVDSEASEIVTLPDLCRPYDLRPLAVLARQDFALQTSGGMLSEAVAHQDTTAILTFASGAGELAARAAAPRAAPERLSGNFGLAEGVYRLGDDGAFERLDPQQPRPCRGWSRGEQP